ncbi:hypothetical protein [Mycolicibacterium brumae]|uniref:Uncharacterized protein n=1 Tax=Mycolicibacterium brumae TaxID=85968 RepID=A0A2G5P936_9MYCO|nr:hypothetical protein [Mycolicibacterium brumae]MCV7194099.1 hypothetical protein [Mycolicibacterium brumae]PIB74414.1 hypothetical protein CQY22_013165 [Mycolicibacterium brumae]RWA22729.1 hypothetical protein MBRU_12325 [Mycolicibacterium brumae DSM 44177]UWW07465.1 hypothetical protein L2Z93_000480 [Mycolicibacterium brumae]
MTDEKVRAWVSEGHVCVRGIQRYLGYTDGNRFTLVQARTLAGMLWRDGDEKGAAVVNAAADELEAVDPLAEVRQRGGDVFVPKGWVGIVLELHAALVAVDPSIQYRQIKEKFGELRVYHSSDATEARELIRAAEAKSLATCESCGNAGVMHRSEHGWYRTLCPSCAGEHEQGYTVVKQR